MTGRPTGAFKIEHGDEAGVENWFAALVEDAIEPLELSARRI
jgi:hypothetical protein